MFINLIYEKRVIRNTNDMMIEAHADQIDSEIGADREKGRLLELNSIGPMREPSFQKIKNVNLDININEIKKPKIKLKLSLPKLNLKPETFRGASPVGLSNVESNFSSESRNKK